MAEPGPAPSPGPSPARAPAPQSGKPGRERPRTSWLVKALAIASFLLLLVACASLFLNKPWEVTAGFLGFGAFLLLVAVVIGVFEFRMEGRLTIQVPKVGKVTLNLARINQGEDDIKTNRAKRLGRDDIKTKRSKRDRG